MKRLSERLAFIRSVVRQPPAVHPGAPDGVWRTHGDCYRFLAHHCPPGTRTLETGLGISTVLFAAWGAEHTCVVGDEREVSVCREYMRARRIPDTVNFMVGATVDVLPGLRIDDLDLFFIDDGHGFPFPALDWFYGGRWLRQGGVLVFDDMQIPAVAHTIGWFLDLDPRWEELHRNDRWAAYRRLGEGDLLEEFTEQLFLGDPR